MKYVRETAAGKSISAYIVTNKKGVMIAKVQAHFGQSTVTVNVFDFNGDGPIIQYGSAGGYGYDKFTTALRGLTVDGHKIYDHCQTTLETEKLLKAYKKSSNKDYDLWTSKARKIGATFANGMNSCYMESGLDRLTALGYNVFQAI